MDGVQLPQGYSHFEEAVYFYHSVPRKAGYKAIMLETATEGVL